MVKVEYSLFCWEHVVYLTKEKKCVYNLNHQLTTVMQYFDCCTVIFVVQIARYPVLSSIGTATLQTNVVNSVLVFSVRVLVFKSS